MYRLKVTRHSSTSTQEINKLKLSIYFCNHNNHKDRQMSTYFFVRNASVRARRRCVYIYNISIMVVLTRKAQILCYECRYDVFRLSS